MARATDQRGITLIELLVAMALSLVVIGLTISILTVVLNDNRYDQFRDDATYHAQTMIDRLSREMRSASSITAGSSGLLADAGPYDLGFQTVSGAAQSAGTATTSITGATNAANHMWVRYCLDSSNTLWRQSTSPSTTTSSFPDTTTTSNNLPLDSAGCPSTSSNWVQTSSGSPCCKEMSDAVNEIGGDNRPLFTFGPTGYQSVGDVKTVGVNLYVDDNPGKLPGPTELTSGIYLRNDLGPPVSSFTPSKQDLTGSSGGALITLDGSASTDPNGQALSYQWYEGKTCDSSSTALSGGTSEIFSPGDFTNGNYWFSLLVTNTGGLTSCSAPQEVTVP